MQASEQQTVFSLLNPVLISQLVGVAIVRHDVGKDAILLSVSRYKNFAPHKLQPTTGSTARIT